MEKPMEMLAQFGYLGQMSSSSCYLCGLVMLIASIFLALNLKKPEK
jgi:hypothetical protein